MAAAASDNTLKSTNELINSIDVGWEDFIKLCEKNPDIFIRIQKQLTAPMTPATMLKDRRERVKLGAAFKTIKKKLAEDFSKKCIIVPQPCIVICNRNAQQQLVGTGGLGPCVACASMA